MKNKTLLIVLNVGLLLVMFSRMFTGVMGNAMILDGIAIAGIAGFMYWRKAKHHEGSKKSNK